MGCAPTQGAAPTPRSDAIGPDASVPPTPAPSAAAVADAGDAPDAAARAMRPVRAERLAKLVADAEARESDALVILQDGKLAGEWLFGKRRSVIQTMSITKSVLSLAAGALVDAGKLRLEQPVSTWFAEWEKDERRAITVGHLLTHSSGLEEGKTTLPIYASRDFVRFTLTSKLEHPPGTHYEYGNRATNLLVAVIEKAAGMSAETYVRRTLFEPLGIHQYTWTKDRAGNVHGMAGLHLLPRDLAKLGELVLAEGRWEGRQVVSTAWIESSTSELAPVQPDSRRLSKLWWLAPEWTERVLDDDIIERWRAAGVEGAFISRAEPLRGRKFRRLGELLAAIGDAFGDPTLKEWNETTWKRGLPDVRHTSGPIMGCYSMGTLGQFLVILPRDRLVAVRMRRMPKDAKDRDDPNLSFLDFVERVQGLVVD